MTQHNVNEYIPAEYPAGQTADSDHNGVRNGYNRVVHALVDAFADRLKTVVLFGSQARDDAGLASDHDLFVVIEGLPAEPLARQRTVRQVLLPILDQLPGPISFVAKTPQEVEVNLTPLLLDVCVDGICLYGTAYFDSYRQKALAALHQSKLRRQHMGGVLMWVFPHLPTTDWELTWEGYFERPG